MRENTEFGGFKGFNQRSKTTNGQIVFLDFAFFVINFPFVSNSHWGFDIGVTEIEKPFPQSLHLLVPVTLKGD